MGRFEGQTVVVTGGARGMGAAHARGFAAEGACVVVADVRDGEGRALVAELGERARFVHLDVADEVGWAALVREAEEAFGPVRVLVNNAGVLTLEPLDTISPATWRRVLDVNLTGMFLGIQAVTPSMRAAGGGAIVNVSSTAGIQPAPLLGAYVASKFGVRGLTKVAALELGRDNIRVNSVHPGVVRTPMTTQTGEIGFAAIDAFPLDGHAIPRAAEPEEITRLVLFLASAEASFATGAEFVADGGLLLGPALQPEPS
ncbi:glucose 1-dehydrogenase [Phytohabitans houttuyneae]|uniref:3-alpha-hydroxysteroid dehydrogenase n=1 Tax=Phytohabitans houttuyneae TaxID=1076126 RepID=A0A6V8KPF3_9ACTN|nr:glucose 1-dehydrogenase [Phytohabitans houttuyneae]GFJ82555.1 3-alpha-hydroxysteroid dehydrogenase [Phytohabitans houttuyneae]